MTDQYPGYQNMIARSTSQEVLQRHNEYLGHYGIGLDECWVENMREITPTSDPLAYRQGFNCHYQVHFTTYKGWKVYMRHTGCFACIPSEEEKCSQTTEL